MHAYNCLFAERFYLRKNIAVLFSVSEGKFFFRYCSEKRESKEMNKKKERKKRKDKQIHLISSFLCVCVCLFTYYNGTGYTIFASPDSGRKKFSVISINEQQRKGMSCFFYIIWQLLIKIVNSFLFCNIFFCVRKKKFRLFSHSKAIKNRS